MEAAATAPPGFSRAPSRSPHRGLPAAAPPLIVIDSFDVSSLAERWHAVGVKGRTTYDVTELDGRRCLRASSRAGASILLTELHADPQTYPWLSWDWRVDRLVEGEALARKDGSDAAARLYVYFESSSLPWQKRNLDYVWSASLPVGTVMDSAYSRNSKIVVVESGAASLGRWRTVARNLKDDYERCFKEPLPAVIAVGVMSDTDNTGSEALAYFDELRLSRAKP